MEIKKFNKNSESRFFSVRSVVHFAEVVSNGARVTKFTTEIQKQKFAKIHKKIIAIKDSYKYKNTKNLNPK